MSSGSRRKRAAVVAAVRGRDLLPVSPSCVPTVGRHSEYFLVPAHYHETRDGLVARPPFVATALDADGNEAFLLALPTELTRVARRIFGRAGLPAPKLEYEPIVVPKETWAAYERLVPEEWHPTATEPHVSSVSGAMPEYVVGKVQTLLGEVELPLAPRVATPAGGPSLPMFRLALRDVVLVQTIEEFRRELVDFVAAEEARS